MAPLRRLRDTASAKIHLTSLLDSPAFRRRSPRKQQAIDLLALVFVGRTSTGDRLRRASAPGTEVLLMKALIDQLGRATLVECKSGIDRTLTATSLMCAADAAGPNLLTRQSARPLFRALAEGLGEAVVHLTRSSAEGPGRIKWSSHPTALDFFPPGHHRTGLLGNFASTAAAGRATRARRSAGRAAPPKA